MRTVNQVRVIVLGHIIREPTGGQAWHYLNYVRGLVEIGHDAYYMEDSSDYPICSDPTVSYYSADPTYGLRFASDAFAKLGLGDRWAYFDAHTNGWKGARAHDARELCETADLVLNISGVNPLRDWLERVPVRAFIDTDPGRTQISNLIDPGSRQRCEAHTVFFSFGETIGNPHSLVPADGFAWQPTRQPVSLVAWPNTSGQHDGCYTTVMHWESLPTIEYGGLRFGMKSESFGPFIGLPQRLGEIFRLAVRGKTAPLSALREAGWGIANIDAVSHDPWTYQNFIQTSKAEFGIAKQGYVMACSGWFSERSAVYLASGRPVLAQDTGFPKCLPCGEGLLAFRSLEDVVEAVSRIEADYDAHCCAARELAVEYFAASRVLPLLIEAAMATAVADSKKSKNGYHARVSEWRNAAEKTYEPSGRTYVGTIQSAYPASPHPRDMTAVDLQLAVPHETSSDERAEDLGGNAAEQLSQAQSRLVTHAAGLSSLLPSLRITHANATDGSHPMSTDANARLTALENSLAERTRRLVDLETALNERSRRLEALENTMQERSIRLSALERTIDERTHRLATLEAGFKRPFWYRACAAIRRR